MRPSLQLAVLLSALSACRAQVVVDRMAAVVNKQVILESELEQTARVEYLIQGKALVGGKLSRPELLSVLDQMIDRALLEQQMAPSEIPPPTPQEIAARLKEVRDRLPAANSDQGWKALLAAYGVSQRDVEEHLASRIQVLRFIDLRFRGIARVDQSEIARYYQEKLLPELSRQDANPLPLADVSGKIEKILIERRVDEMLSRWLEALRSQAHIERMAPAGGGHP